jgi:hypothetical protein
MSNAARRRVHSSTAISSLRSVTQLDRSAREHADNRATLLEESAFDLPGAKWADLAFLRWSGVVPGKARDAVYPPAVSRAVCSCSTCVTWRR